jgi:hypothetical protein
MICSALFLLLPSLSASPARMCACVLPFCGVGGRPGEIDVCLEIDRVELCTAALTA